MNLEEIYEARRDAQRGAWWTSAILCFAGAGLVYYLAFVLGYGMSGRRQYALIDVSPSVQAYFVLGLLLVAGFVSAVRGYRKKPFPENHNEHPFL